MSNLELYKVGDQIKFESRSGATIIAIFDKPEDEAEQIKLVRKLTNQ